MTLLSALSKAMERVHEYLYNYIIINAILTTFQSDFVRGDSTTNELLNTYHTFCNAVDSGKVVRAVFCNISKAFDRVWHRGNDIVKYLGCSIRLFADDTSLYIIVEYPNGAAHSLKTYLNTISTCSDAWVVAFNTHCLVKPYQ